MKVLVVSGIWPPDVGGPASHGPEVARFLRGRGHEVEVVTTASAPPAPVPYPVRWASRRLPRGVRHARALLLVAARARRADVVYSTGMLGRSALGARLARCPYVLKLTGDYAFERARRADLVAGDLDEFQRAAGGVRVRALRRWRDLALRGAAHVFTPSEYLRGLALGWGVDPQRVSVLPNPAPAVPPLPGRDEARRALGLNGRLLVFAGRLTTPKSLGTALEAVARVEGVSLAVAGDGPDRAALEAEAARLRLGGRVRFLGAQPRERVLELFRAGDASILSSTWENFPHGVVEALAVGTPVIATRVGGVAEIVEDGVNGLLVEPGDAAALAARIEEFFADAGLRERLGAAAAGSVDRFSPECLYGELERVLQAAAR